ncbi:hypothetical protein E0K93_16520 [Puniceibacterium sp. HSS470]|nr:hypothetical protein E0K93_16520 [Puniceibacterium sp. HSS470]
MKERLWEIPSSWEWTVIKELGDVVSGATPSTKVRDYWDGDVIWFAPSDLTGYRQKFIARGAKTLTEEGLANSSARIMPAGSVMFSSRAPVGYVAINSVPAATNQGFKSVVPYTGVFNDYLYHYLKASKQLAEQRATGTTFKELSGAAFGVLPAPLPPTNEQRRIVEKIEAMFDEIDKGVESLQTARTTLGLYRHSLLKSAFEGRLTADWRAQNVDKLETPETLLARIQSERDAHYKSALDAWQNDLSKWRAGGEKGKKPAKPKRPKTETNQPLFEVISVSDLPSTWAAPKLVEVIDIVSGATPKGVENCTGSGVPFFKVSDMNTPGNERTMISAQVNASYEEAASLGLPICPIGTVVFPKRGGAILTNKKRRLGQPSSFDLNTMGFVNRTETIRDDFLWFWMLSVSLSDIYDGSNVPQINNKNVEPLSFPICPPAEQAEIVRLLDAKLEAADALGAEIDDALTRADAMRQSILKKAFSGQLVPQDPDDEPASALLEQIKAEKAEREQAAKRDRISAPPRKPKAKRPTLTDLIEVLEKQQNWISAAKAAQELGIGDGSTSDDVEAFYRQLKDFVEDGAIEVERRGDEDWLRLAQAKVS